MTLKKLKLYLSSEIKSCLLKIVYEKQLIMISAAGWWFLWLLRREHSHEYISSEIKPVVSTIFILRL